MPNWIKRSWLLKGASDDLIMRRALCPAYVRVHPSSLRAHRWKPSAARGETCTVILEPSRRRSEKSHVRHVRLTLPCQIMSATHNDERGSAPGVAQLNESALLRARQVLPPQDVASLPDQLGRGKTVFQDGVLVRRSRCLHLK